MTWIKSSLQRPDGRPLEGVCVTAALMTRPGWRADGHGQIFGEVTTRTDSDGLWRLDLAPYTNFEAELIDFVYYQIDEGSGTLWKARVPPVADPTTELWLRDVLIETAPSTPGWRPISMLGQLFNVDNAADAPHEGDVLFAQDGQWVAGPLQHRFVDLTDVDPGGMDLAQPGDPVVYLGGGRIGVQPSGAPLTSPRSRPPITTEPSGDEA